MKVNRLLNQKFWLITVVIIFILLIAGFSVFWHPYKFEKLTRAIPATATIVSVHDNLAERYETYEKLEFLKPVQEQIAQNLPAVSSDDLKKIQYLLKKTASKKTLLAYVPHDTRECGTGVVIVSWLGAKSLFARWYLNLKLPKELERRPAYIGHSIWSLKEPVTKNGWRLTFTIHDGALIAMLSPDASALKGLIHAAEGIAPRSRFFEDPRLLALPPAKDVFWMEEPLSLTAAVTVEHERQFALVVNIEDWMPASQPQSALRQFDFQELTGCLGDIPTTMTVFNSRTLSQLAFYLPSGVADFLDSCLPLPAETDPGCLGMTILGDEHGGRLGISLLKARFPALVLFTHLADQEQGRQAVRSLLDYLNARYKSGLIAGQPISVSNTSLKVFPLEATTGNILTHIKAEERPGYVILDNWLVWCSSSEALMRRVSCAANVLEDEPRWLEELRSHDSRAMVWLNASPGIRNIQQVLGAWSILASITGNQEHAAFLKAAREFLATLSGSCEIKAWLALEDPLLWFVLTDSINPE